MAVASQTIGHCTILWLLRKFLTFFENWTVGPLSCIYCPGPSLLPESLELLELYGAPDFSQWNIILQNTPAFSMVMHSAIQLHKAQKSSPSKIVDSTQKKQIAMFLHLMLSLLHNNVCTVQCSFLHLCISNLYLKEWHVCTWSVLHLNTSTFYHITIWIFFSFSDIFVSLLLILCILVILL